MTTTSNCTNRCSGKINETEQWDNDRSDAQKETKAKIITQLSRNDAVTGWIKVVYMVYAGITNPVVHKY